MLKHKETELLDGLNPSLRGCSARAVAEGAAGLAWCSADFRRIACREFEDDRPEAPPAEGVRILGAEEAQAAGRRRPRPRQARGAAAAGAGVRHRPDDVQPGGPVPLPGRPTRPATTPGRRPDPRRRHPVGEPGEPSGAMPLPHWTEPATGEVPMIADEPGDEEVWAAASSEPRFRSDAGDWASPTSPSATTAPRRDHRHGCARRRARDRRRRGFAAQVAARRAAPARAAVRSPRAARRGAAAARPGRSTRPSRTRPTRRTSTATPRVTPSARRPHRRASSPVACSPRSRCSRSSSAAPAPGARDRHRRRRRVRAVRGLPPGRVPARDPPRAARLPLHRGHRLQPR